MTDASVDPARLFAPAQTLATTSPRGSLKVYLGAMPGSGKTFAMVREGHDRRGGGEDVVVGFVDTHGRPRTEEAVGTLEVVPRITVGNRGIAVEEMDLAALLARRPQVALVDELAHINAPGVRHARRWQDIEELCRCGIDVITTLNIQHLESMKDVVERITGVAVEETLPDSVLDAADELQFIDITPEALRKRVVHGNAIGPDTTGAVARRLLRPDNLAALREIGLRYVAERVGSDRGGLHDPHEDVLVYITGGSPQLLIRRAVRIARRHRGVCAVLHVRSQGGDGIEDGGWRQLAAQLQCPVIESEGVDPASTLISAVRLRGARHLVIEAPPARRAPAWLRPTVVDRSIEALADVDIHVIGAPAATHNHPGDRSDSNARLQAVVENPNRGSLRIYLGYARGCGATVAMLEEARRRAARGTDVVVAAVGGGGGWQRLGTLPLLGGKDSPAGRGVLDIDALLARNPDVAAVDDLAGRTTAGGLVADALPRLRAAGITVIGTTRLPDLRSTVATMGSLLQRDDNRPAIDDAAIDSADELELVDIVPGELEERLRRGDIMPLAEAISALQGEFRPDVLAALREAAFGRVAQHCDRRLVSYMTSTGISEPLEAQPRMLVCVPPRPGQDRLIQRAATLAAVRDDALTAVSVRRVHRRRDKSFDLGGYAALTRRLGGEFVTVDGYDVAATIARYARDHGITEIIALRGSHRRQSPTLRRLIRQLAGVDVHVIASTR